MTLPRKSLKSTGQYSHITCELQVKKWYDWFMARKTSSPAWRSGCPLNASVEMLGDRWSLLIIRDLMLHGARSYRELLECPEGIATNILADRLRKLERHSIVKIEPDARDRRRRVYELTNKGIDLAPVLTELVLWAAAHERTGNQALVQQLRRDKTRFMAEIRRRWTQRIQARKPD